MRSDFDSLFNHVRRLAENKGVDKEFLEEARDDILSCNSIADSPGEKTLVATAISQWRKTAARFGMDMTITETAVPASLSVSGTLNLTAQDKRFLRSLRIAAE